MRATDLGRLGWGVLALVLAGCGSGGGGGGDGFGGTGPQAVYGSLGELEDDIEAAAASGDTDGDGVPDVVEARLGTDDAVADTDGDGLVDTLELFGSDWARSQPLPDGDRDGLIAPLDPDDDGDGENDGMQVDTDGDGVPNFHELYGYTYEILTGRFLPWNGDPAVPHFFTDPLQPSTDQDAYPDGMEASGALLDPTVDWPGSDPLVPAYPNVVVELVAYTATLNETVQITESESIEKGQSWTRQTETTHSREVENTWEIGGEVSFGKEAGAKVSGKYGQTYHNTNSTAVTQAFGQSIATNNGWSEARSVNPVDAARLALHLRIRNRGSAPISDLVPTISLKIGGLGVATFEPAGANVNLLVPGGTYPAETGWAWVVDAKAGGSPLSLTMHQLRALERGAPVSLSVTQMQGQAMRLDKGGTWQSVGDTSEFTARCDAVCANLRIELGDGTLVHHLVYADDAPSAPRMTLGSALGKIGVDADGTLFYEDADGAPRTRSLRGFHFAVDPDTLRRNGWTLAADDPTGNTPTAGPEGFVLDDLRLFPDSVVYVREPRPAEVPGGPSIYFACFDSKSGEIEISADDYKGVARVVVHNEKDPAEEGYREQELVSDVPDAGFFTGNARGPGGFDETDVLTVDVVNLDDVTASTPIGTLFTPPGPANPLIHEATVDLNAKRVYAQVESGNPDNPNSDVDWIAAYHPDFDGGFVKMERVYDYFRDPLGYEAELPDHFGDGHPDDPVEIVAFVVDGVLTVVPVPLEDAEPVQVRHMSTVTLTARMDEGWGYSWRDTRLNLHVAPGGTVVSHGTTETGIFGSPTIPGAPTDVCFQWYPGGAHAVIFPTLFFNAEYVIHPVGGLDTYRFLARDQIVDTTTAGPLTRDPLWVGTGTSPDVGPGDVLVLKTIDGYPAKMYLEAISFPSAPLGQHKVELLVRYVVFEKP